MGALVKNKVVPLGVSEKGASIERTGSFQMKEIYSSASKKDFVTSNLKTLETSDNQSHILSNQISKPFIISGK